MSNPELLKDLLTAVQCLKKELTESDVEEVKVAQEAYQELLDGFYEEYQDVMAPQQYTAAMDDPEYFLVLIPSAYYDQGQKNIDSNGEQSIPYFNWKIFTQI